MGLFDHLVSACCMLSGSAEPMTSFIVQVSHIFLIHTITLSGYLELLYNRDLKCSQLILYGRAFNHSPMLLAAPLAVIHLPARLFLTLFFCFGFSQLIYQLLPKYRTCGVHRELKLYLGSTISARALGFRHLRHIPFSRIISIFEPRLRTVVGLREYGQWHAPGKPPRD